MMTLEELQKKLESYPERLEKALVHQSESEAAVEQIQEEIKLAQSGLTEQENPEGQPHLKHYSRHPLRGKHSPMRASNNASGCLKLLNAKGTIPLMQQEMNNPANFGMAKSLITMGMQRGFDMTTQEGIDSWIATYNAEIRAGTGTPVPLPGIPTPSGTSRKNTQTGKAKRRGAQNRRK